MGRASQLLWYLNMDIHPTQLEREMIFTHIDIDEQIKSLRRIYRRAIRSVKPECAIRQGKSDTNLNLFAINKLVL